MDPTQDVKCEVEKKLLNLEMQIKEKELIIKNIELEKIKGQIAKNRFFTINAVNVAIIVAAIAFVGNIIGTIVQGCNALNIESQKAISQEYIESQKFRSNLIIEAIKTGDPKKAADNLKFFISAGFLEDKNKTIESSISQTNIPVLPATPGVYFGSGPGPQENIWHDDGNHHPLKDNYSTH